MRESRKLVYVSGAPGSGKSTLAVPLAAELGYALLTKDRIKETLHDAMGAPEPDRAWSRRLGAAMELLWALAADAPAGCRRKGVGAVFETLDGDGVQTRAEDAAGHQQVSGGCAVASTARPVSATTTATMGGHGLSQQHAGQHDQPIFQAKPR